MAQPQIKCPAGIEQHPVLSPNPLDVECSVQGNLRPARRSNGELQVCCDEYWKCAAWKSHKNVLKQNRTVRVAEETRGKRSRHTVSDTTREKVRA